MASVAPKRKGLNAFELLGAAINLSSMFDTRADTVVRHTRFTTRHAPDAVMERLKEAYKEMNARVEVSALQDYLDHCPQERAIVFVFCFVLVQDLTPAFLRRPVVPCGRDAARWKPLRPSQVKSAHKMKAYLTTLHGPSAINSECTEILPGVSMVEFTRGQGDHFVFYQMYTELKRRLGDFVAA